MNIQVDITFREIVILHRSFNLSDLCNIAVL